MTKKRSKSDPQMRATFLHQVHYMEQFHQFPMQAIEVWSPTVQIRQLREEKIKLKTLK
jgi:hypothetical protein